MTVSWIQYFSVFAWNWHLEDADFTSSRNSHHDIIYSIYIELCHYSSGRHGLEKTDLSKNNKLKAALSLMLASLTFKFFNPTYSLKNYLIKLYKELLYWSWPSTAEASSDLYETGNLHDSLWVKFEFNSQKVQMKFQLKWVKIELI